MSIKEGERHKRSSAGKKQVTVIRQDQTAPKQFKKNLSLGANKTELLQFLLNDLQDQPHMTTIGEKSIFITLGNEAYAIEIIEREMANNA